MEAQLGSQAMNLQALIQGRNFRDGLQQWGEAKAVESGAMSPKLLIEEEGVLGCGAARKLTKELVAEMGVWVWDLGENREGIVES
ncbi:glutathione synthase [Sesbania bispinosa]|nr:glutathione synthase [Sesbania bispinosa]